MHLANVGGVNLGELGGDDRCRDSHRVHQIGALIPGAAIVTIGDPYGLAIGEAGSRGEAHRGRFRLVLVNCSTGRGGGHLRITGEMGM